MITSALKWKFPGVTVALHLNEAGNVVFDTWTAAKNVKKPSAPDIAIITSEYQILLERWIREFDANTFLHDLNDTLTMEELPRVSRHTTSIMSYCGAKKFWGDKSLSTFLAAIEASGDVNANDVAVIKKVLKLQNIDLDNNPNLGA